jgi:hypothetical protein
LTVDGHYRDLLAELDRQGFLSVDIHDFKFVMIALLFLLKKQLGFFTQVTSAACEQNEMKMFQVVVVCKQATKKTKQGVGSFPVVYDFLSGRREPCE